MYVCYLQATWVARLGVVMPIIGVARSMLEPSVFLSVSLGDSVPWQRAVAVPVCSCHVSLSHYGEVQQVLHWLHMVRLFVITHILHTLHLDLLESSLFFWVFLMASNKLYCLCRFLAASNLTVVAAADAADFLGRSFFSFDT